MRDLFRKRRMWRRTPDLKDRYDVVIIGGGSHGLSLAYYLARDHGITDVCVLEQGYIGSGAAGRNTTILRSNYKTLEGAHFYDASVRLYEGLSAELRFNLLFSQQGHLTLAHTDRAMFVMNERAEVNQLAGIDSKVIGPEEIARLAPAMSLAPDAIYPVMGALYHPPGGIIRHDAVVWGLASGADSAGAEIHPYRKVTGIERSNGRASGVVLADGRRISQTDRGEFLVGAEIEPWTTYRQQGTLNFLQECSRNTLELFPQLERARILRSWAGLCDITPDYSPILGRTEVDGFLLSAGWGTYGFKAAPIVGKTLAELIATDEVPELIESFTLERFYAVRLVSEVGSAAVSH